MNASTIKPRFERVHESQQSFVFHNYDGSRFAASRSSRNDACIVASLIRTAESEPQVRAISELGIHPNALVILIKCLEVSIIGHKREARHFKRCGHLHCIGEAKSRLTSDTRGSMRNLGCQIHNKPSRRRCQGLSIYSGKLFIALAQGTCQHLSQSDCGNHQLMVASFRAREKRFESSRELAMTFQKIDDWRSVYKHSTSVG